MNRMSIGEYAREILKKPLYKYQEEIGDAILDSVLHNKGLCFTVMLGRQMGKNQLSAVIEAYLLKVMESGTIVKAAPTFKPQIEVSRQRLLSMLSHPDLREYVWRSHGYIVGLARDPKDRDAHTGSHVIFFSAEPEANIVGATASILLEIDEAQDISIDKFNRDLRPMGSTTNATTVLYGTAWTEETLLATIKANNQQLEQEDGIRRHFQYDWSTLAAINPTYKTYVENEIKRMSWEHETIRTQYRLLPISGAGYLFNTLHYHLLHGQHAWQDEPDEENDDYYIAGMDVGGEERANPASRGPAQGKRDSTVLTIARVVYAELDLPRVEVVHQYWFTGMLHGDQYAVASEIIQRWNLRKVIIDATGLGESLASLLIDRFSDERIVAFKFSRPSKSRLTHQFIAMITSSRLRLYSPDVAPAEIYEECWQQIRRARYRIPGQSLLDMYVPPEDGHDDFLISLALCCEGTREWSTPIVDTVIIPPRPYYGYEYW